MPQIAREGSSAAPRVNVPDFDGIARDIVQYALNKGPSDRSVQLAVESLHGVWNARGAADLQAIDVEARRVYEEATMTGRTDIEIDTVRAIKALDR